MSALMIISMTVEDDGWMEAYFAAVPALLADHGGVTLAAARRIGRIEGGAPVPDRMAVMRFPSVDAIERFMADERYQPFREARQAGAQTEIFAFENGLKGAEAI